MKKLLPEYIQYTDESVDRLLKHQVLDGNSCYHGALLDENAGYANPSNGVRHATLIMLKYSLPQSRFYNDPDILIRGIYGVLYSFSRMHSDNTFDLTSTNPHDPTSIAFTVRASVPAFRMFKKHIESKGSISTQEAALFNYMMTFYYRAVDGIVGRGFHTPNHRWVVASALAMLKNLLDMPELMQEIDRYMAEGIDCDEYGEYAERSIAIYNLTNNKSLLILAFELDRMDLLLHVRRNLNMSMKYIEPDGTLFTLNSTRQDFGKSTYPTQLFEYYAVMAHIDDNADFAYMAKHIFDNNKNQMKRAEHIGYSPFTMPYLYYDEYIDFDSKDIQATSFDFTSYNSFFPNSNIARIREKDSSLSILAQHNIFMKFMTRFASVHMKFLTDEYISFDTIEKTISGYTLKSSRGKMSTSSNLPINVCIDLTFNNDEVELDITAQCDFVYPCAAVLLFNTPGMIKSGSHNFHTIMGKHLTDNTGNFKYFHNNMQLHNTLQITHDFTNPDINNTFLDNIINRAHPLDKNAFTVFLSADAPFNKKIIIKGV